MDKTILPNELGNILDITFEEFQAALDKVEIKSVEEHWRLPTDPEVRTQEPTAKTLVEKLAPLHSVFIDDSLKDDIITKVSIPDLIEGNQPQYSGIILFGPPGNGKTVLLRAIRDVFYNFGAYAKEISTSQIDSAYVSEFPKNLEKEITTALSQAQKRGKPSFLMFDEGSIITQKADLGASSTAKHYQQAIEVLKRYIGNERNLIVGISTNQVYESFEEALTRDGRVTSYFIPPLNEEQKTRMWRFFSQKYGLVELTDEQAVKLAKTSKTESGAFIEEYCRAFFRNRRNQITLEKGCKTLIEAYEHGVRISDKEVGDSINFENLFTDVQAALKRKYDRINANNQGGNDTSKRKIGF